MQTALELLSKAKSLGIKNVDDFIARDGLFGKDKYSPEAATIARGLNLSKSTDVKAAARQYAQDAAYAAKGTNTLLGDAPTPAESFKESFGALESGAVSDAAKLMAKSDGTTIPPGRMMRPFPDVPFDKEAATRGDVLRGSRVFYRPGNNADQMGIVYVNAQSRELLTHMGDATASDEFNGLSMDGPRVRQVVHNLDRTMLKNELGVGAVKPLFALRQALQKSLKDNGKAILVDAGPGATLSDVKSTIRHELHHAYETDFTPEQA